MFSKSVTTNISDVGEVKELSVRLYRTPASVLFQHFAILSMSLEGLGLRASNFLTFSFNLLAVRKI